MIFSSIPYIISFPTTTLITLVWYILTPTIPWCDATLLYKLYITSFPLASSFTSTMYIHIFLSYFGLDFFGWILYIPLANVSTLDWKHFVYFLLLMLAPWIENISHLEICLQLAPGILFTDTFPQWGNFNKKITN